MALVWDARQRRDTGGGSAFVVHERIATGGMAEVFLATRRGLEGFAKPVVLKRILPEYAEDDRFCEMFVREARLGAHLSHPNIVQVLDLGRDGGSLYIALEYVPGPDLARWIRVRRNLGQVFDTRLACHIVHEIVAALEHAHDATDVHGSPLRIVHRDVSPHNVLISTEGAIKLGDFGIARAHADDGGSTQVGTVKGKLSYMAPEQARGDVVDARTDLYAATVVLYELLTLQRPFGMSVDPNMILRLHAGDHTPIEQIRADLPAALRHFVEKGLSPRQEDRFQSAAQMRAELAAFLGGRSILGRAEVATALTRDLPEEVGRAKKFVHRALSPIPGGRTETIELSPAPDPTTLDRGTQTAGAGRGAGTLLGPGPTAPVAAQEGSKSGIQPVPAIAPPARGLDPAASPSAGRSRSWALALVFALVLGSGVGVGMLMFRPARSRDEPPPATSPTIGAGAAKPLAAAALPSVAEPAAPAPVPLASALPGAALPPSAVSPVAAPDPGTPAAPRPRAAAQTAHPSPARPAAPAREQARLTVRTPNGWTSVWVNGQGPFMAPFRDRPVPAGRLSLRFSSPRGEERMSARRAPARPS